MDNILCLIAIFKNESHVMQEWIHHYIREGVQKFFLIDNGSTDHYLHILEPYIKDHIVELVVDDTRHSQSALYNKHFLIDSKDYKWVLVCDLDEFVYARNGFKTILKYLTSVEDIVEQITIPWKLFGSSGYNTIEHNQPEKIVPNFLFRKKASGKIEIKSITRTDKLLEIHQHRCHLLNKKMKHEDFFAEINEEELKNKFLHLNHYPIQSLEWFLRVKATRGDVWGSELDSIRDESYFRRYDVNDILDSELSIK